MIHYVNTDPSWVQPLLRIVLALDFLMVCVNAAYLWQTRKVFGERWWPFE